jgi:hypothetical protein
MTVVSTRQPNIEHGSKYKTSISSTLFNTILETTTTKAELECSWEVVEQYTSVHEHWEAKQRYPINQN